MSTVTSPPPAATTFDVPIPRSEGPLTWELLMFLEPRLFDLWHKARHVRPDADDFWQVYESFKRSIAKLLGAKAIHPRLQESVAYELAHQKILAMLEKPPPRPNRPGRDKKLGRRPLQIRQKGGASRRTADGD